MEKILIGKYVNTHGIKGEIRIKSDFNYKDRVFIIGNSLYIKDKKYTINSYRVHKEYDMVTFKEINNINEIIELKGSLVYIDKSVLKLKEDEYLDKDLINFIVYVDEEEKGKVKEILYLNKNKKLIKVNDKLVPFELIKEIKFKEKKIILEKVEGLL